MEWTTTDKEAATKNSRIGLDRCVRDFKVMYVVCTPLLARVIYLSLYVPLDFTITDFTAIACVANQLGRHFLLSTLTVTVALRNPASQKRVIGNCSWNNSRDPPNQSTDIRD